MRKTRKKYRAGLALTAILLAWLTLGAGLASAGRALPGAVSAQDFVWPLSGSAIPDLPQSSTYGPRLKAGEAFRYDYHQGIDIPTPTGTLVLAVMTGTVRIAGSHPLYQDGVVQVDHGEGLFSNYIHITASLVTTGQQIARGQPLAQSWVSASGFPHLHFEIRDGSVWRKDTVHPMRFLPYTDTIRHTMAITELLANNSVWVQVTAPPDELDIGSITLTVRNQEGLVLGTRILDYEARNEYYNGDPAVLDNPELEDMVVSPHKFVTGSPLYIVDVLFTSLPGRGPVDITACAVDIQGNEVCEMLDGHFDGYQIFMPGMPK